MPVRYQVTMPFKDGSKLQLFETKWGAEVAARWTGGTYNGPVDLDGIEITLAKKVLPKVLTRYQRIQLGLKPVVVRLREWLRIHRRGTAKEIAAAMKCTTAMVYSCISHGFGHIYGKEVWEDGVARYVSLEDPLPLKEEVVA